MSETWTFTFSAAVENHAGNQVIGVDRDGITYEELVEISADLQSEGIEVDMVDLGENAAVLVIRNGLLLFMSPEEEEKFVDETVATMPLVDKKAFMVRQNTVVNKRARYNLCYANFNQKPAYEEGKGRVISFERVPYLAKIRDGLRRFGPKATDLFAELNYYYDIEKCGIGWHGDSERSIVIGCRVGAPMPLYFCWFQWSKPISEPTEIVLNGGDVYIMSEKAVGTDWKKRKIPTLRHATGCEKYTTLKRFESKE